MTLKDYSRLRGKHALFSPSQPSFFELDAEGFLERLISKARAGLGTEIHELAELKIKRRHKITSLRDLVKSTDEYIFKKYYVPEYDQITREGRRLLRALNYISSDSEMFETVKAYVNDAIGFRMNTEVPVAYSERFFGTADALIFSNGTLRIHDLKTGSTPAHVEQLLGYDALYCLQNELDPTTIEHELRIYQSNDILVTTPSGEDVIPFMDKITMFDQIQLEFEGE